MKCRVCRVETLGTEEELCGSCGWYMFKHLNVDQLVAMYYAVKQEFAIPCMNKEELQEYASQMMQVHSIRKKMMLERL